MSFFLGVQKNFNPRPPRGGRRELLARYERLVKISIHVLREEDDLPRRAGSARTQAISIHVLREEDDRIDY